jgi:hypothetical protein
MKLARALVASSALAASALALASVASAKDPKVIVYPGRDAAALAPQDSGTISRTPPDPTPMTARMQWVLDLRWTDGAPYLVAVHALDLGAPQPTPRAMGRFAVELFEGPTLIERVRFDFPMLGGEPPADAGYMAPPDFTRKMSTRIGVLFPQTSRGTRLELWDRATGNRWALPWPPEEAAADGGTSAPGDASKGS